MLVLVPWRWYHRENANTLIGAAIMKSGHPYIWVRYREPIIGGFRGKNPFCFLSENECLDGMELVYIFYIFF